MITMLKKEIKKVVKQRWVAIGKVELREAEGWKVIKKNEVGDLTLMEKDI